MGRVCNRSLLVALASNCPVPLVPPSFVQLDSCSRRLARRSRTLQLTRRALMVQFLSKRFCGALLPRPHPPLWL